MEVAVIGTESVIHGQTVGVHKAEVQALVDCDSCEQFAPVKGVEVLVHAVIPWKFQQTKVYTFAFDFT